MVLDGFVAKESKATPKKNHLTRLQEPMAEKNCFAAKRFRNYLGVPFAKNWLGKGGGMEGDYILCEESTQWLSAECRNWVCHDRPS